MMMSLTGALLLSAGLLAQETTEISIKVTKDGKVVKDTTYSYEDGQDAKHVLKMVEAMSGADKDMKKAHYNYTMSHTGGKHSKAMVFISEDGEKTEIKTVDGDTLVWVSEGDGEKMHMHGENVFVMKKGDGETFDILLDDEGNVKKKQVKVVVSGDGEGNWHAISADEAHMDEHENVFVISEGDVKTKVHKIVEESEDGENVKVIVIKKEIHEDCEHEHEKDVDVEVVKKKVKKVKKEK